MERHVCDYLKQTRNIAYKSSCPQVMENIQELNTKIMENKDTPGVSFATVLASNAIRGIMSKRSTTGDAGDSRSAFDVEDSEANVGFDCDNDQEGSCMAVLLLAFQSLGVVYGDLGTSPLYVFSAAFPGGIEHVDDVLGVFSLIFYTITLIAVIKYVFIALPANHNGAGGNFALYSLLCQHMKVGFVPAKEVKDELVDGTFLADNGVQSKSETTNVTKHLLLFVTLLATSMLIGDGILCPCISVLSAVEGMKNATSHMTEGKIVWVATAVIILLFMAQRFGTDRLGYSFAPILFVWFTMISGIGIYNFFKYDPTVAKALHPKFIVDYFRRNTVQAWASLGGIVLSITGAEALFADLSHFSVRSIQVSMCLVTYPALVFAYAGQASFLRKNSHLVADTFYKSVPVPLYWPMLAIAVLASIVASQALISGTFSIIQQSQSLGCFPHVRILHTSKKHQGQIYIPAINYMLMLACICITLSYKSSANIANSYGMAVVFVMVLTSGFLVLIMLVVWNTHPLLIIFYITIIGTLEVMYLASVLSKFTQGGYLPLALAVVLMAIMYSWHFGYRKECHFRVCHRTSLEEVNEIIYETCPCRVPGMAFFHSESLVSIKHYIENVSAVHSVLVIVSRRPLAVWSVPTKERLKFQRLHPHKFHIFSCIVSYGYNEEPLETKQSFESLLIKGLKEFITEDQFLRNMHKHDNTEVGKGQLHDNEICYDEMEVLQTALGVRVVHLVSENEILAGQENQLWERFLINYAYRFMKKNLRNRKNIFSIPPERSVKLTMTCEL